MVIWLEFHSLKSSNQKRLIKYPQLSRLSVSLLSSPRLNATKTPSTVSHIWFATNCVLELGSLLKAWGSCRAAKTLFYLLPSLVVLSWMKEERNGSSGGQRSIFTNMSKLDVRHLIIRSKNNKTNNGHVILFSYSSQQCFLDREQACPLERRKTKALNAKLSLR